MKESKMAEKTENKKYSKEAEVFFTLREQKREIALQLTNLNKQIDEVQKSILGKMEDDDLESCTTEFGSLTRKVEMYPQIKNADFSNREKSQQPTPNCLTTSAIVAPFNNASYIARLRFFFCLCVIIRFLSCY